jgi:hypothetical protein
LVWGDEYFAEALGVLDGNVDPCGSDEGSK